MWLIVAIVFSALATASCQFVEINNSTWGLFTAGRNGVCIDGTIDVLSFHWLHTVSYKIYIDYATLWREITFCIFVLISYAHTHILHHSSLLQKWAAICGILAPVLGTIVLFLMLLDCCCKVCCSNLIQTILLTGAEMSQ